MRKRIDHGYNYLILTEQIIVQLFITLPLPEILSLPEISISWWGNVRIWKKVTGSFDLERSKLKLDSYRLRFKKKSFDCTESHLLQQHYVGGKPCEYASVLDYLKYSYCQCDESAHSKVNFLERYDISRCIFFQRNCYTSKDFCYSTPRKVPIDNGRKLFFLLFLA